VPEQFDPPLKPGNGHPAIDRDALESALANGLGIVFDALDRRHPGDGDIRQAVTDPRTGRRWVFTLHRGDQA
jgi:hypothetical protein